MYISLSEGAALAHKNRATILRLAQLGKVKTRRGIVNGYGPIWQVDADSLLQFYGRLKPAQKPASTSKAALRSEIESRQARKKILTEELAILDEEIQMRQQLLDLLR